MAAAVADAAAVANAAAMAGAAAVASPADVAVVGATAAAAVRLSALMLCLNSNEYLSVALQKDFKLSGRRALFGIHFPRIWIPFP